MSQQRGTSTTFRGARKVGIEIRSARTEDLPRLAGLYRAQAEHQQALAPHWKLLPDVDWERCVAGKLDRLESEEVFVADRNGRVVGYTEIRLIDERARRPSSRLLHIARKILGRTSKPSVPIYQPRRFGQIDDIFLEPTLRRFGSGIAFRLFERSLTWFEAHGVQEIEGLIWYENKDSLDFFHKTGCYDVRLTLMADIPTLRARFPRK